MSANSGTAPRRGLLLLYVIAALALLVGLYARFKGLGAASMAPDEYYIARSVQNILRFGIPEFDCGGYYARAFAFQYLVALFAHAGADPGMAARWVAAISSVVALPAIYILARRAGGRALGLAVLAILAVSVWEVEIARFGRMYAPFQTVFLWYMVFVVRLTIDRESRALLPLFILGVLGIMTWEGGAFLALANLMLLFARNPRGRFDWRSMIFAAANIALFLGIYMLLSANLRLAGDEPQFPADFDLDASRAVAAAALGRTEPMWAALRAHPAWVVLWLIPVALALNALRWTWALRERWPAALGLLLGLAMALLHQFAAVGAIVLLLVMLGHLQREDWQSRGARFYGLAIAAALVFWLAFGFFTGWRSGVDIAWLGHSRVAGILYEFVRLPDVTRQMAQPWFSATPVLAVGGALLLGIATWQVVQREDRWDAQRILILVLLFMATAVGATSPPREETRYVFFLFPLAIIVLLVPAVEFIESRAGRRGLHMAGIGALGAFVLYAFTEDFQPRHLLRIDSPVALMRTDLSHALEAHVVPRTDVRGAAQWLSAASRDKAWLRVNGYPSADYYFADFDFAYLDRDSRRFRAYSCRRGAQERWGGLPLMYDIGTLNRKIALTGGAFIVTSDDDAARFMSGLAGWNPRVAWRSLDGEIEVLALGAAADASP